jgi:hypothetical protein
VDVRVFRDEVTVLALDHGGDSQPGLRNTRNGLRAILHHVKSVQSAQDAEFILDGDG